MNIMIDISKARIVSQHLILQMKKKTLRKDSWIFEFR